MLEHLGAYGIDADALSHRAIAKGAPGYNLVLKAFGEWILDAEGQVDRVRLAKIVFSDSEALERLEAIVHPLVTHAIDLLVRRSKHSVVVIEAIKLLETDIAAGCDTIWVVDAPRELRISRLMHKRNISEAAARQRISTQAPQALKLRAAKVVVRNDGTFENTWDQVQAAWIKLPKPEEPLLAPPPTLSPGQLFVRRGKPQDADQIARFITRITHGKRRMTRNDVMAEFGEKAYLLIERDGNIVGLAGWQVENLVARIDEIYFETGLSLDDAIPGAHGSSGNRFRRIAERGCAPLPPAISRTTRGHLAKCGLSSTNRPRVGSARMAGGRNRLHAPWRIALVQETPRGSRPARRSSPSRMGIKTP